MKITYLGHAGMLIETHAGSILCDPWFTPAYFSSWFPFPDNAALIPENRQYQPTYVSVSHLHQDHFDAPFLKEHVWKEAIILLPEYPLPLLERAFRDLGFTRFCQTRNGEWHQLDAGLKVMTLATVSPSDGPLGDCGLAIDDGETRIFNQNDARPRNLTNLLQDGKPIDAHFLQFSGAIWYPMVYDYPEPMMRTLGKKKRENEMLRSLHYIEQIQAKNVFPSSGPACFLDDPLFEYNDFDRDPHNSFPDQVAFLDYMQEHGRTNGHLIVPESVLMFEKGACRVQQPSPESQIRDTIFAQKRTYLEAYRQRQKNGIEDAMVRLPRHRVQILAELKAWFEPLLAHVEHLRTGIDGRVVLDCQDEAIVIDFPARQVYAWDGQANWRYYFQLDRGLLEQCILEHTEDWVNRIFLSFRFTAQRKGAFNEYVYTFFKCLSPERIRYAESYYAQKQPERRTFERHGYRIQQTCPHGGADLAQYGSFDLEQGVLTCQLHGWQFDLNTGRCFSSDAESHRLWIQPLTQEEQPVHAQGKGADIREKCDHCWFRSSDLLTTQATQENSDPLMGQNPS